MQPYRNRINCNSTNKEDDSHQTTDLNAQIQELPISIQKEGFRMGHDKILNYFYSKIEWMKLLIVEDNKELLKVIGEALSVENFHCELVASYADAHEKLFVYDYDCAIIDVNLPDGSGLDLIRECKTEKPQTGIIVISARNSLDHKIEGLDLGADDYLTKPFDMAELIARVKSIIRRRNFDGNKILTFEQLTVDVENRSVAVNNKVIKLTKIEYNILLFFLSNPKRVLTKESIAEHVWGDNMDLVDSFDFIYSHIKNLKKKIAAAAYKIPLNTVYGIGYKLEAS